jgi:hypothetical protein
VQAAAAAAGGEQQRLRVAFCRRLRTGGFCHASVAGASNIRHSRSRSTHRSTRSTCNAKASTLPCVRVRDHGPGSSRSGSSSSRRSSSWDHHRRRVDCLGRTQKPWRASHYSATATCGEIGLRPRACGRMCGPLPCSTTQASCCRAAGAESRWLSREACSRRVVVRWASLRLSPISIVHPDAQPYHLAYRRDSWPPLVGARVALTRLDCSLKELRATMVDHDRKTSRHRPRGHQNRSSPRVAHGHSRALR